VPVAYGTQLLRSIADRTFGRALRYHDPVPVETEFEDVTTTDAERLSNVRGQDHAPELVDTSGSNRAHGLVAPRSCGLPERSTKPDVISQQI
jgi:hypothetical protein